MTAFAPCPAGWEYDKNPRADTLLRLRTDYILSVIATCQPSSHDGISKDGRIAHHTLFKDLTPEHFPYFAGNYRGSPGLRCLDSCEVTIPSDPRVGHPPATIQMEMKAFAQTLDLAFRELDHVWSVPSGTFSRRQKIRRLIEIAASLFVYFLEIHPYANGNGHIGRLLLICVFARHGVFFQNWPVHPRPQDPPYSTAIADYRSGNKTGLLVFIASCI